MEDIHVRLINLPTGIRGMTALDEEGDYNVYINARYSYETRLSTLEHEMAHINKGHFYNKEMSIQEKETI